MAKKSAINTTWKKHYLFWLFWFFLLENKKNKAEGIFESILLALEQTCILLTLLPFISLKFCAQIL